MAERDPKRFAAPGTPAGGRDLDSDEDPLVELARIVSEDGSFYAGRKSTARRDAPATTSSEPTAADLEAELLHELEASLNAPPGPAPNLGAARRSATADFKPRPADRKPAAPAAPRHEPAPSPEPAPYTPPPVGQFSPARSHEAGGFDIDRESQDLLRAIEAQLGDFERRAHESASEGSHADWEQSEHAVDDEWQTSFPAEHPPHSDQEAEVGPGSWEPSPPEGTGTDDAEAADGAGPAEDASRLEAEPASEAEPSERPKSAAAASAGPLAKGAEGTDRPRAPWNRQADPLGWDDAPVTAAEWTRDATRAWEAEFNKSAESNDPPASDPWSGFEPGTEPPPMDWLTPEAGGAANDDLRGTIAPFDPKEAKDVAGKSPARVPPASLETRFSDPSLNADWQGSSLSKAAPLPDDEDDNDPIPAAVTPVRRKPQAASAPPKQAGRRRRGLATALALIGVVLLGGAVAAYMRSFDEEAAGPPPVIAAEEGPVKMVPESQASADAAEAPGAAVYDRVAGTGTPAEETMVNGAEEPREVARIVLPTTQQGNSETLTRSVGTDAEANLPKKVRTVIVKADGTVVETMEDASPRPAPAAPPAVAEAPDPEPIRPTPVETTEVTGSGDIQPNAGAPDEASTPVAALPDPTPTPPEPAAQPEPEPQPVPQPSTPAAAPAAAAPQQAERVASVDLLAGAPKSAATGGDGFHVQLSSQRSEVQAIDAFEGLKRRFPSLLGNMAPVIQRADLGDKGIYYRVRVGPMASRDAANEFCNSLKAAGGNCFVAR